MTDLASSSLSPTSDRERLRSLDALRGFALLGIMFVNFTWFTGFAVTFHAAPDDLAASGTLRLDTLVYQMVTFLIDSKFWSIFALLFGAGFGLQWMRSPGSQRPRTMARRLAVLLVIGFLHGVFIWFGDIVSLYALTGFGLLLFSRASERSLLRCGMFFLALPILQAVFWLAVYHQLRHNGSSPPNLGHGPAALLPGFATGSVAEAWQANWAYFVQRWIRAFAEGRIFKLLGMFLLGAWFASRRLFHKDPSHRRQLWWIMLIGLTIGTPLNGIYAYYGGGIVLPLTRFELLITVNQCIGIPAMACGYVASFLLIHSSIPTLRAWDILALVGRMSLTNYLVQSLIGVAVFYGCGMGMWGSIGITHSLLVIAVIFVVQATLSYWWLHHFRMGPMEWLVRCLVYTRLLPLRSHTQFGRSLAVSND